MQKLRWIERRPRPERLWNFQRRVRVPQVSFLLATTAGGHAEDGRSSMDAGLRAGSALAAHANGSIGRAASKRGPLRDQHVRAQQ
jgi:hypothetical protein